MCVYGGGAVPKGGLGDRHLATVPRRWWGTVFRGVGNDKGGGEGISILCKHRVMFTLWGTQFIE